MFALLAFIPIVFCVVVMAAFNWPAKIAMPITWLITAILGFAAACAAMAPTMKADIVKEKALLDSSIEKLSQISGVKINGAHEAPHILNLSIPGVPTQNTINILQDKGICVSAGSACAKGHRSHTLTSMRLFKTFRQVVISSALVSVVCFFLGITLSYLFDLPGGASVVLVNLAAMIAFSLLSMIRRSRRKE